MDPASTFSLRPLVSKACSRCHARKVKCDQQVPRCAACVRQNEECNISDCVSYPYSAVSALLTEIDRLNGQLRQQQQQDGQNNASNMAVDEPLNVPVTTDGEAFQPGKTLTSPGKEAEEVGVLAIGGPSRFTQDQYVGSAAGSTFARIFFKQLNLGSSDRNGIDLNPLPTTISASLPSWATAKFLLMKYIACVHTWWPFLPLPRLRRLFYNIYGKHRECSKADRFTVFMILALASSECEHDAEYSSLLDLNEPRSYFETALRFFVDLYDHPRDLFGVQAVLLMSIWMANSSSSSHCNDLWHLGRYAMSISIELGLHRHNADWGFSADELETRNRTWWCVYVLERQVAVLTGRVLSIRDHAIHALWPTQRSFDLLREDEAPVAAIFHKHNVELFRLIIRLRQQAGRILESVYIGRGPDGRAFATSFQQIYDTSETSRRDLAQWKQDLDNAEIKPSKEYYEAKIEYCLLVLLLNQPSPTFMVPSTTMVSTYSKCVSSAVRKWTHLRSSYGPSAICRCYRQLHNILVVALAALYCDWRLLATSREHGQETRSSAFRHYQDVTTCINMVQEGIQQIKNPALTRYRDLLRTVKGKVYEGVDVDQSNLAHATASYEARSTSSLGGVDVNMGTIGQAADGFGSYISNVSSFFDEGYLDLDPALSIWYDAIREEIF